MLPKVMVQENLSVLMEDNRFRNVPKLKKKDVPHSLHWFMGEDYFSNEIFGLFSAEVSKFKSAANSAFELFEKATEHIINEEKLSWLGIPSSFHSCIKSSWEMRKEIPMLYGRFDINGGLDNLSVKVIEFNADTCSTLPETVYWQPAQLNTLSPSPMAFNTLKDDISSQFKKLRSYIGESQPVLLASSFGHPEDINNCNVVLDCASSVGFSCFYENLESVIFSDEGIFVEIGHEYQPVDIWFKMIPWDWIVYEEPELADTLSHLILNKKTTILNPPFTMLWQNKKFLSYITTYFPNQVIAETYLQKEPLREYVEKPVYGRIGENIKIVSTTNHQTSGDYGNQEKVYQKFYPLPADMEKYYYQTGIFYTYRSSALNLRAQNTPIITEDCEFMSHYLI